MENWLKITELLALLLHLDDLFKFHSVHSALTTAISSFNGSSKSLGLLTALKSTFKETHSFHEVGHFPKENATIFPPCKLISPAKGCTSWLDSKQTRTTLLWPSHSLIHCFASVRELPERQLETSSSRIFTSLSLITKLPGGLKAFTASQKWSTASICGLDPTSCKISKRRFLELFFPLETIFGCTGFFFPFFDGSLPMICGDRFHIHIW